jgi:hypothetical protein
MGATMAHLFVAVRRGLGSKKNLRCQDLCNIGLRRWYCTVSVDINKRHTLWCCAKNGDDLRV